MEDSGGGLRELLYWPFLDPCCDSIFNPLCLCFFDGQFSTGGRYEPLPTLPQVASNVAKRRLCDCVTARLTDWLYLMWIPVYLKFHNTYPFFRLSTTWTAFACLHKWNILFQKSKTDGSVKGLYTTVWTDRFMSFPGEFVRREILTDPSRFELESLVSFHTTINDTISPPPICTHRQEKKYWQDDRL